MWEAVTKVANEPGQLVTVEMIRELASHFGPNKGKRFRIPVAFVGTSFCNVSAGKYQKGLSPVTWRFIRGSASGGDDLNQSPAVDDRTIEIDAQIEDVVEHIAEEFLFGGIEERWWKWKHNEVVEAEADDTDYDA